MRNRVRRLELCVAVVAVEHVAVAALALWDFVIGPWYWRRRFAERAETETPTRRNAR